MKNIPRNGKTHGGSDLIVIDFFFPTFSFGSPGWYPMQQRPAVASARTAGGSRLPLSVQREQDRETASCVKKVEVFSRQEVAASFCASL